MKQRPRLSLRRTKLFPGDRRRFRRYRLQLPLTVEVRSNGRARLLERVPALENISAGGLCFSLAADTHAALPPNVELEIRFPLVEPLFHPARVYARCRARLLRREGTNRVAAHFEELEFIREERLSGLPFPITT